MRYLVVYNFLSIDGGQGSIAYRATYLRSRGVFKDISGIPYTHMLSLVQFSQKFVPTGSFDNSIASGAGFIAEQMIDHSLGQWSFS